MPEQKDQGAVAIEDVRQIAALARLRLDEKTVEELTGELNGILEHVRVLETLDVSELGDVSPASSEHVRFRDPSTEPDELLQDGIGSIAPEWREGFFVVPRLPALDQESPEAETE